MQRSFIELVFDVVGSVFFRSQQEWERRRSAKIMTTSVTVGVILGLVVVWVIKHMNTIKK